MGERGQPVIGLAVPIGRQAVSWAVVVSIEKMRFMRSRVLLYYVTALLSLTTLCERGENQRMFAGA